MIGHLYGQLVEKQPPLLMLDIQGVGYEIHAPMSTFYQLPAIGEQVKLLTQLIVREDAHLLYGFYTNGERELFRTLLKVNGIGAKLALTILSSISTDDFVRCVINHDTASLVALPGVGKKTAERLVIEMRDKLDHWHSEPKLIDATQTKVNTARQDAISALIALGYKQQEALRAVTKVDAGQSSSEELIRLALREMMI